MAICKSERNNSAIDYWKNFANWTSSDNFSSLRFENKLKGEKNVCLFFDIWKLQLFNKSIFARIEKLASGSCDTQWSNIMASCFCISTRSSDECCMFPRVHKKLLLFKKTLKFFYLLLKAKILFFIDENKVRPS